MSVAFRRESDEEHKELRFELPIPPGPNLVIAAGLAQAEAKVAALKAAVAGEATLMADLRRELRYWNTRLATAELAPPPPAGEAGFGSRVTFRMNGESQVMDIVGHDEAEPANGRIAFSAPLARALIGAGPGDFSDFGGKADAIEIVALGAVED